VTRLILVPARIAASTMAASKTSLGTIPGVRPAEQPATRPAARRQSTVPPPDVTTAPVNGGYGATRVLGDA
jgi:hypothetical protein